MAAAEIMSSSNNVMNKMMRPPAITPNYGKKKSILPKTNLPKVVLHDNVTQEQMLQAKLNNIRIDMRRSSRMLELTRRSFIVQQSLKQEQLRTLGIHVNFLPDDVVKTHLTMSKYRTATKSPPQSAKKRVFPKLKSRGESGFVTKIFENGDIETPGNDISLQRPIASSEAPIRRRDSAKNVNRLTSTLPALRSQSALEANTGGWRVSSVKGFTSSFGLRKEKTFTYVGEYSQNITGVKDPRFVLLQNVLIPSDRPTDGFIQLSPCGREVMDRYKRNLARPKMGRSDASSRSGSSASRQRSSALRSVTYLPSSVDDVTKNDDGDSDSEAGSVSIDTKEKE